MHYPAVKKTRRKRKTKAEPAQDPNPRHVLGLSVMQAVREDMKQTVIPSWVSPAPMNWGTTERGKLSADQWKTVCTVHLVITLVRLWGGEDGRKYEILSNFMDLITAVVLLNMRFTSESLVVEYEEAILRYLQGLKALYKDAKFKPIHHASLHLGEFLRFFGPVHAYRSFPFERFNYMLQKQNTNAKFGG